MATKTVNGARFDYGAQHFSACSEVFRERVPTYETSASSPSGTRRRAGRIRASGRSPAGGIGRNEAYPRAPRDGLDVRNSIEMGTNQVQLKDHRTCWRASGRTRIGA